MVFIYRDKRDKDRDKEKDEFDLNRVKVKEEPLDGKFCRAIIDKDNKTNYSVACFKFNNSPLNRRVPLWR